jgi:serine/threonine-protein kinase
MSDNEALNELIAGYLQAVDAGEKPDPSEWLARHPEHAESLRSFFAAQHEVEQVVGPVHDTGPYEITEERRPGSMEVGLPEEPRLPRTFGSYELTEELGRGGMGIVYTARDLRLNRLVALKMLRFGHLATPTQRERLQAEAGATAALDHPHIVPVYEVGEEQGQCYLTMKRIEGVSLARRITESRPDCRTAAQLVASIARAVHHVHERGLVHRDLKPSNVLLDAAGQPHVTDLGLSRWLDGEEGLTSTGAIVGTPAYMAPEQALGSRELSRAVDIHALGAILYELLTGRAPFQGATDYDVLRQVVSAGPVPPSRLGAKVPRDLEAICLKCLEKEPRDRYLTAAGLAEDLKRWLDGGRIKGRPVGRLTRAWRWQQRNRMLALLLVLTTGVAGLHLAVQIWNKGAEERAIRELEAEAAEAAKARSNRGSSPSKPPPVNGAVDEILNPPRGNF